MVNGSLYRNNNTRSTLFSILYPFALWKLSFDYSLCLSYTSPFSRSDFIEMKNYRINATSCIHATRTPMISRTPQNFANNFLTIFIWTQEHIVYRGEKIINYTEKILHTYNFWPTKRVSIFQTYQYFNLSPFFYMLTSYYSPRGSLVLFDNVKNRVVDQNNKRLFPATPARVEFLVSMGTLSPVTEANTTCKGRA